MRIFFSSPGRRVELIKIFKKEIKDVCIIGGDYSQNSPALLFCDKRFKLPYKINDEYIHYVLKICIEQKVNLVIPLIDHELELYAKYKKIFARYGIVVMISSEESINISADKMNTFDFFDKFDFISNPFTSLLINFKEEDFSGEEVILKPKNGSSGIGVHKVKKQKVNKFSKILELNELQYIVQEYIDFDYEITTDVFIDNNNKLIELCQRKRLKVRGGEVERAVTSKDPQINKIVEQIVKNTSFFGVINIQFMIKNNKYYIGEINPRFGGGFPLSYYSGANMIEHFKNLMNDNEIKKYDSSRYEENFYMLRFDDAIYTKDIIND